MPDDQTNKQTHTRNNILIATKLYIDSILHTHTHTKTVTIQNIDETKLHIIWQLCGLPVKFSSHLTYFECKNYLSFSTSHFSLWHCFSTEGQTTKLCFIPFQFRDIKLEWMCVTYETTDNLYIKCRKKSLVRLVATFEQVWFLH